MASQNLDAKRSTVLHARNSFQEEIGEYGNPWVVYITFVPFLLYFRAANRAKSPTAVV